MVGAAGLIPAIPALPMAAAPAVAPSSVQYAWASYYAQVHNAASPARLSAALKVSPQVAQGLMNKLLANGVITAPGSAGISAAVKPFHKARHLRPTAQGLAQRAQDQLRHSLSEPSIEAAKTADQPAAKNAEDPQQPAAAGPLTAPHAHQPISTPTAGSPAV